MRIMMGFSQTCLLCGVISCGERLSKDFFHKLKACLFSCSNSSNTIMIHLSCWDQHLPERGRVFSRWLNCIGLLIDNIVVPVIVFKIFNSIADLGAANLSNWSLKLTSGHSKFRSGIIIGYFRISDFFWKLGSGIIIKHGTILGSLGNSPSICNFKMVQRTDSPF